MCNSIVLLLLVRFSKKQWITSYFQFNKWVSMLFVMRQYTPFVLWHTVNKGTREKEKKRTDHYHATCIHYEGLDRILPNSFRLPLDRLDRDIHMVFRLCLCLTVIRRGLDRYPTNGYRLPLTGLIGISIWYSGLSLVPYSQRGGLTGIRLTATGFLWQAW